MTLALGLDSAYAPSFQQAYAAKGQTYQWWGFYIQGVGDTDPLHAWTPGEEQNLLKAGIKPVPICVPSPAVTADPVVCATQAFNSCKNYGLSPTTSVCYDGEHIFTTGPVWLPVPGTRPTAVGPGSAIQYGTGSIENLAVDLNISAPDFPMNKAIVCDLEANAGYTPQWYALFQHTIATLAKGNPPVQPTLNSADIALIQLMMRQEFTPGTPTVAEGELYGRVREAVTSVVQTVHPLPPAA